MRDSTEVLLQISDECRDVASGRNDRRDSVSRVGISDVQKSFTHKSTSEPTVVGGGKKSSKNMLR